MYHWYIDRYAGLSLSPSEDHNVPDFKTLEEGQAWVREQLCSLLLGNPVDSELYGELGRNSYRRQWLLDQAKRELL